MVAERFMRKDSKVKDKCYFRPRVPGKIQEVLGWKDADGSLYEWRADTKNGCAILVRIPTVEGTE